MLTLIVILINVGILFYYFLFERNVIYWSGLVQRRDLTPKILLRVDELKLFIQCSTSGCERDSPISCL